MQIGLGWTPHPHGHHHGGHHGGGGGGGFFPGWWGGDGYISPGPTVYEVQQDNTPLYLIGGAALIGLLILSRR